EAKRYKNITLAPPIVKSVVEGTFYAWLKAKGKLGGQHKVPRLSNTREYIDDILLYQNI
ncbi:MAG TPA: GH3 auxin-responsive promoter family protein, partial [Bacteroidales bacterium]|nr:GH3 auxin-responsive promoter family protein [Bacteroidales bacterium]